MAPHYKHLARETRAWHHIIGVAALDCAESENSDICNEKQKINHYPTFKLFNVFDDARNSSVVELSSADKSVESLMRQMIDFVQASHVKPSNWPNLEPFE